MKKIFTFIAAAILAVSANAQTWKVIDSVRDGKIAEGATLIDNDYATVTTANQDGTPYAILDEAGNATTESVGDYTFQYGVNIRVTNAPSASSPTGTAHSADDGTQNIAVVVDAKQNTDLQLYIRIGSTKTLNCYNQTTGESVSGELVADNEGDDNLYATVTFKLIAGNKYTVWATGGTIRLYGFDLVEGTYVEPSAFFYANAAASANAEGFSTMTYADGASISLTGNSGKSFSSGSSITIGSAKYTGTKVSNGAQNTFYAPEGKKVYVFTIYSYINLDAKNRDPYWKEVGGVEYECTEETEMQSYKDGANPDVFTYVFPEGAETITFTNAGEQVIFVIEANYDPTGVAGVSAAESAASAEAKTVVKDGRIVIVKGDAEYSVSGAQLK